jgi:hypothetical protein
LAAITEMPAFGASRRNRPPTVDRKNAEMAEEGNAECSSSECEFDIEKLRNEPTPIAGRTANGMRFRSNDFDVHRATLPSQSRR